MSHCPCPAGGKFLLDSDKVFPSSLTLWSFRALSIHPTWTHSFQGRRAGQNQVTGSILGDNHSLYLLSDYHLVLDHPVLHTLPRSFYLVQSIPTFTHSVLPHVFRNACILPRWSRSSICYHCHSPQRPCLRRTAITTLAYFNNGTSSSSPQHID
jgi:hypothetical protein